MTTIHHLISAEELIQMPNLGRCELLRGELNMMSPAGSLHGKITARLGAILYKFVDQNKLGIIFGAETGFHISHNPDSVLAPDVSFVYADKIPDPLPQGFFPGAPDLAVEVLSPNDRASGVKAKIRDWLDGGCPAVWIVDPNTKSVTIYKTTHDIVVLTSADTLADEQILPGFSVLISEIFK